MASSSAPQAGSSGSDTVSFLNSKTGVTYNGGAGNDYITGSKGDDVIRGGTGADRIQGGTGNDTYVFVAGDLVSSLGQGNGQNGSVDHIIDFQGAGANTGSGYNDQIALYGYSAAAYLRFDHYAADRVQSGTNPDGSPKYVLQPNYKLQYYQVVDPADASKNGFILVQMADGTNQLDLSKTSTDVVFYQDAISGVSSGEVIEAGGTNNADPGIPVVGGKLTATTFDQTTSFKAVDSAALVGKYGSFTFASDGTWTYSLDNSKAATEALKAGQTETETLSVQTLDGTMKTLTVQVHGADDVVPNTPAMIGGMDTGAVKEDGTSVTMGQLAINDPDAGQGAFVPHLGGDALAGAYGSLTIDASGNWTYSLDNAKAQSLKEGEVVQDAITVASVDGTTHTITVTLNGTNDAPTGSATAKLAHGAEDTGYVVSKAALLSGFSDVDGDALSVVGLTADHGSVADNGNGTYTITPQANYNGTVALSYTVTDGHGGNLAAGQSFLLDAVNDAPVANPDSLSTNEDVPLRFTSAALLGNDSDVDGNALSIVNLTQPTHGTLSLDANGSYIYTPNAGYFGPDSFTYQASDGGLSSNTALVSITVAHVNHAPVAYNDQITVQETDRQVQGNVLANDTDPDGDPLTATLTPGGTHYGTLSLNADGSFNYTIDTTNPTVKGLNEGQSLTDTYIYAASDGHGGVSQATLAIFINGVTDAAKLPGTVTHIVGTTVNDGYIEQAEAIWSSGATTTNAYTGEVVSIAGLTRDIDTYDGNTGSDTINGTSRSDALIYNTAFSPDFDSAGTPVGTSAAFVRMEQFFMGLGNDVLNLTSGANGSQSYNGATNLQGGLGDDTIWGGGGNEIIVGENNVFTNGVGGNDFLHGGAGNDTLVGDGRSVGKSAVLGNDIIDGGTGNDLMFGDGQVFGADFTGTRGHNTFRFDGPGSGQDQIGAAPASNSVFFNGYQHGLDHLQLSAKYGFTAVQALARTADNAAGNAVVDLGNGDTITLYGVHKADLTAADFIIA